MSHSLLLSLLPAVGVSLAQAPSHATVHVRPSLPLDVAAPPPASMAAPLPIRAIPAPCDAVQACTSRTTLLVSISEILY